MRFYSQPYPRQLLALLLVLLAFAHTACNKNNENQTPTISNIRSYVAAPADSVLTRVGPGAWIVIQGTHLKTAKQVFFDGVAATFNPALLADDNLVVQIPAGIPFASVPTAQMNTIRVVTEGGEATFMFPILAPPPVITAVSNEFANPGDYVTLTGNYLYLITKITFPGNLDAAAADITAVSDGSSVRVKVPASVRTGGIVTVKTQFGTASAPFGDATGMLLDFDAVGAMLWGATVTNSATRYPGGRGNYASMVQDVVAANNWEWYNGKRAINSAPADWVPTSQLTQPAANYALKFEMYVKEPWSTGALLITPADTWVYTARYEPWKTTPNFKTTGWQTVSLPLSTFKLKDATLGDGNGTAASTVGDIIGKTDEFVRIMFINDTATPLPKLDLAIDNIRVVKLK